MQRKLNIVEKKVGQNLEEKSLFGNIDKNIAGRDLKIYMNMQTITMYLHIKFHVNWLISLGDG